MDDLTESNPELCQQRVSELEKDRLFHFVYDIMTGHTLAEKITSTVLHVAVLVFTLIHLVAWNWEFPAPLIQQLWRWFNIGATAGFILFEVILVVCSFLDLLDVPISTYFVGICLVVVGIIYVLLRLGVLGLTFYCLSSMPERAYTTMDWLAWIPHFS